MAVYNWIWENNINARYDMASWNALIKQKSKIFMLKVFKSAALGRGGFASSSRFVYKLIASAAWIHCISKVHGQSRHFKLIFAWHNKSQTINLKQRNISKKLELFTRELLRNVKINTLLTFLCYPKAIPNPHPPREGHAAYISLTSEYNLIVSYKV